MNQRMLYLVIWITSNDMTSDVKTFRTGIRVGSTYVYYLQHWSSLGRTQHGLLVSMVAIRGEAYAVQGGTSLLKLDKLPGF